MQSQGSMKPAQVVVPAPCLASGLSVSCLEMASTFANQPSLWNRWLSKTTDIDLVLVNMYLHDTGELRICPCMESPCSTREAVKHTRMLRFPLENPYVGWCGQAIFHEPCFPVSASSQWTDSYTRVNLSPAPSPHPLIPLCPATGLKSWKRRLLGGTRSRYD